MFILACSLGLGSSLKFNDCIIDNCSLNFSFERRKELYINRDRL